MLWPVRGLPHASKQQVVLVLTPIALEFLELEGRSHGTVSCHILDTSIVSELSHLS